MTPERLAELAALEQAATPGNWRIGYGGPADNWEWAGAVLTTLDGRPLTLMQGNIHLKRESEANAAFIAAARIAIPELIADRKEMLAEVQELKLALKAESAFYKAASQLATEAEARVKALEAAGGGLAYALKMRDHDGGLAGTCTACDSVAEWDRVVKGE